MASNLRITIPGESGEDIHEDITIGTKPTPRTMLRTSLCAVGGHLPERRQPLRGAVRNVKKSTSQGDTNEPTSRPSRQHPAVKKAAKIRFAKTPSSVATPIIPTTPLHLARRDREATELREVRRMRRSPAPNLPVASPKPSASEIMVRLPDDQKPDSPPPMDSIAHFISAVDAGVDVVAVRRMEKEKKVEEEAEEPAGDHEAPTTEEIAIPTRRQWPSDPAVFLEHLKKNPNSGEFVHLSFNEQHGVQIGFTTIYDLEVKASYNDVDPLNYFTLSNRGVTWFRASSTSSNPTIFVPLSEWSLGVDVYKKALKLTFFRYYRVRKAFMQWRWATIQGRMYRHRLYLERRCILLNPHLSSTRLLTYRICRELAGDVSLLAVRHVWSYSYEQFLKLRVQWLDEAVAKIENRIEQIVSRTSQACYQIMSECGLITSVAELERRAQEDALKKATILPPGPAGLHHKRMEEFSRSDLQLRSIRMLKGFVRLSDYILADTLTILIVNASESLLLALGGSNINEDVICSDDPEFLVFDALMKGEEKEEEEEEVHESEDSPIPSPLVSPLTRQKSFGDLRDTGIKTRSLFSIRLSLDHTSVKTLMNAITEQHVAGHMTHRHVLPSVELVTSTPTATQFVEMVEDTTALHLDRLCGIPRVAVRGRVREMMDRLKSVDIASISRKQQDLVDVLKQTSSYETLLSEIRESCNRLISPLHIYVHKMEEFVKWVVTTCAIDNVALDYQLQQTRTPSLDWFKATLKFLSRVIDFITQELGTNRTVGPLDIGREELAGRLITYPNATLSKVTALMPIAFNNASETLISNVQSAQAKALMQPQSLVECVEWLNFLQEFNDEDTETATVDSQLVYVTGIWELMHEHNVPRDNTMIGKFYELKRASTVMASRVTTARARMGDITQIFEADLRDRVEACVIHASELRDELKQPEVDDPNIPVEQSLQRLRDMRYRLDELIAETDTCLRYQKTFQKQPLEPPGLAMLRMELLTRLKLVESWSFFREQLTEWRSSPVLQVNTEIMNILTGEFEKDVAKHRNLLQESDCTTQIAQVVADELRSFQALLPVIADLQNPALLERHWHDIQRALATKFPVEEKKEDQQVSVTLGFLLEECNLLVASDQIREISTMASVQQSLENVIARIDAFWTAAEFTLTSIRSRNEVTFLLENPEFLLKRLEDDTITLRTTGTSAYGDHVQDQVHKWQYKLGRVDDVLSVWVSVQHTWIRLDTLFSAPDLRKQLPEAASRFIGVDYEWRRLMANLHFFPGVLTATAPVDLVKNLQSMEETLDEVKSAVEEYLNSKRQAFPRFCFVSNDELLDVLTRARNPRALGSVIGKTFSGIGHLECGPNHGSSTEIFAMITLEGERLALGPKLRARGGVEHWLAAVEGGMIHMLKRVIRDALRDYLELDHDAYIARYPSQVVLLVHRIFRCRQVSEILSTVNPPAEIQQYADYLTEQIDACISDYRTATTHVRRIMAERLIVSDLHNRDVAQQLTACYNVNEAVWQSQMRCYWDNSLDTVIVRQGLTSQLYGYEFAGLWNRQIISPSVTRQNGAILQAVGLLMSPLLVGSKSDLARDIAAFIARPFFEFTCSDKLECEVLSLYLVGAMQTGSWLLLNHIERLVPSVLAVLQDEITQIGNALVSGQNSITFTGRMVEIKPDLALICGCESDANITRGCFRPILLCAPDIKDIAVGLLTCTGMSLAVSLGAKISVVFELCRAELPQYSFDASDVHAIVEAVEVLTVHSSHLVEHCVAKAVMDTLTPRLSPDDIPVFTRIVTDTFGDIGDINVISDGSSLRSELIKVCQGKDLSPNTIQLDKMIELHDALQNSRGVVLVGPPASSKSVCVDVLAEAMGNVDVVVVNAMALAIEDMYGHFDAGSHAWVDGVVSRVLRDARDKGTKDDEGEECPALSMRRSEIANQEHVNIGSRFGSVALPSGTSPFQLNLGQVTSEKEEEEEEEEEEQQKMTWIVFDGPLDASWMDHLESGLDSTKSLSLVSGERLDLAPQVSLIIECGKMANASPSVLSRCTTVVIDGFDDSKAAESEEDDVECKCAVWRSSLESWLASPILLSVGLDDAIMLRFMANLCHTCLEKGMQWMQGHTGSSNVVDFNAVALVQSFTHILSTSLNRSIAVITKMVLALSKKRSALHIDEPIDTQVTELEVKLERVLSTHVVFALTWSFGCVLRSVESRKVFDSMVRSIVMETAVPTFGTVFDADVDAMGVFRPWLSNVGWTFDPSLSFWDNEFPSPEYSRVVDVLRLLMTKTSAIVAMRKNMSERPVITAHEGLVVRPILLVGPSSAHARTMSRNACLQIQRISEGKQVPTFCSNGMSAAATPSDIHEWIESFLDHEGTSMLVPKAPASMACCVLEHIDTLKQPVLETLRLLCDGGRLFSLKKQTWSHVKDTAFVMTTSLSHLPPDAHYSSVTASTVDLRSAVDTLATKETDAGIQQSCCWQRTTRHCHVIALPEYSHETMASVFKSMMSTHFSGTDASVDQSPNNTLRVISDVPVVGAVHQRRMVVTEKIVALTLKLLNRLSKLKLSAFSSTPHLRFNHNDVAMVFVGMLMASSSSSSYSNPWFMSRLWVHELSKVFRSRVVESSDVSLIDEEVAKLLEAECDWLTTVPFTQIGSVRVSPKPESSPTLVRAVSAFSESEDELSDSDEDLGISHLLAAYHDDNLAYGIVNDSREYESMDIDSITGVIEQTAHTIKLDVVVFKQALQRVVAAARALWLPRGHALLIGSSGTGRRTCARLAARLASFVVVDCSIVHGEGRVEFRKALKQAVGQAALQNKPCVLLLTESEIAAHDDILSDINHIVANGHVPGLFRGKELDHVAIHLVPQLRAAYAAGELSSTWRVMQAKTHLQIQQQKQRVTGAQSPLPGSTSVTATVGDSLIETSISAVTRYDMDMDGVTVAKRMSTPTSEIHVDTSPTVMDVIPSGPAAAWELFCERTLRNLHVVMCLNDDGAIQTRMENYPVLRSCFSVDRYPHWTQGSLLAVGNELLSKCEGDLGERGSSTYVDRLSLASATVDICMTIHDVAKDNAALIHLTSPSVYIQFIQQFVQLLRNHRSDLTVQKEKLSAGVRKLAQARDAVETMQADLSRLSPVLARLQIENDSTTAQIQKDQANADATHKVILREEREIGQQNAAIESLADEAQKELDVALPALNAAITALRQLSVRDIVEVKSFINPPAGVVIVMEAVCVVKRVPPSWDSSRQLMSQADAFIRSLMSLDKDKIPVRVLERLRRYTVMPEFSPEKVEHVSKAAKSLCQWIHSLVMYRDVSASVDPKRRKVKELQAALDISQSALAAKQEELFVIETELNELKRRLAENVSRQQELAARIGDAKLKLGRANTLVGALSDEKVVWEKRTVLLDEELPAVIGSSLLSAACLCYLGPFSLTSRSNMIEKWERICVNRQILFPEEFDPIETLIDSSELRLLQTTGLPRDKQSTLNGILSMRQDKWPLFIDPQGQASRWIRRKEHKSNLAVIIAGTVTSERELIEKCVRKGLPLLIEHIGDDLDPVLHPLLRREWILRGSNQYVALGDKEIPVNPLFKCYLTTRERSLSQELSVWLRVIEASVTEDGLSDQLLLEAVRFYHPHLEEELDEAVTSIVESQRKVKDLEDMILQLLSRTQGSILDDDELGNALTTSKESSDIAKEKMNKAIANEQRIEEVRVGWQALGRRASILYMALEDLEGISALYRFSLDLFVQLFKRAMSRVPLTTLSGDEERSQLSHDLTHNVYQFACLALPPDLWLSFAFVLSVRIQRDTRGLTSDDEIDTMNLVLNPLVGTPAKSSSARKPDWLSDEVWNELGVLESRSPRYRGLRDHVCGVTHVREWEQWCTMPTPSDRLPLPWAQLHVLERMPIVRILRPQLIEGEMRVLISSILGHEFLKPAQMELGDVVKEWDSSTPVLLVTDPNADAVSRVHVLAVTLDDIELDSISAGYGQAVVHEVIEDALRVGKWVVVKDAQAAESWFDSLEKIVEDIASHDSLPSSFRLFLCIDSIDADRLPIGLYLSSVHVHIAQPLSLRESTASAMANVPEATLFGSGRGILRRLLFSLCNLDAILRLRGKQSIPLLTQHESDRRAALRTITLTMARLASNEPPNFALLAHVLGENIYGTLLPMDSLVYRQSVVLSGMLMSHASLSDLYSCMLTPSAALSDVKAIRAEIDDEDEAEAQAVVDGKLEQHRKQETTVIKRKTYTAPIEPAVFGKNQSISQFYSDFVLERWPDSDSSSSLLGVPYSVIKQRETVRSLSMLRSVRLIMDSTNDVSTDWFAILPIGVTFKNRGEVRRWYLELLGKLMAAIPSLVPYGRRRDTDPPAIKDLLQRETLACNSLLSHVRRLFDSLRTIAREATSLPSRVMSVAIDVAQGKIPESVRIRSYPILEDCRSLMSFLSGLQDRAQYLQQWQTSGPPSTYRLPMHFFPHSLFTAIKIAYGQIAQVALDQVVLNCVMGQSTPVRRVEVKRGRGKKRETDMLYSISGMVVIGGHWDDYRNLLVSSLHNDDSNRANIDRESAPILQIRPMSRKKGNLGAYLCDIDMDILGVDGVETTVTLEQFHVPSEDPDACVVSGCRFVLS